VVAFTADAPGVAARFRAGGVPALPSPERAVRAWRALWRAGPPTPGPLARPARLPAEVEAAVRTGRGPLPYVLARRALEAYGIRFCREAIVATADEAAAAADGLGYPVVVKADALGLTHKTDVGGLRLDVRDAAAVREACRDLAARVGARAYVVQEQIGPGAELLIGGRRDEVFGPVVAFGTGGVLAEVVRDVAFGLAPIADDEVEELLGEGPRARLLAGARGRPPVERAAVSAAIKAVGDFLTVEARVLEVDLNPVIAAGPDVVAVDAIVIVGP
jgi:acyl-CoA synthetase (NDP forming)